MNSNHHHHHQNHQNRHQHHQNYHQNHPLLCQAGQCGNQMGTKFWQLVRFFSSSAASSPYGSILGTTPFSLSQFLQPLVFLFDFKVVSKQLQECCQGCREHGLILSYLYLILKLCQNNCKSIIKYQIFSRLLGSMD